MNGKTAKKLRSMAKLINQSIPDHPEGKPKKSVSEIYEGLKMVHKKKLINGKKQKITT